ncbi:hypothetical protein BKG91_01710 [Rodentibacter caecimuris]|uniref:Glucose-6-phosphate isomerase n=1 Tax=Rodentibacter caecimuris TaxID=1796644 RepID=A0A1V3KPX7_9PAST|nr:MULTISPECIES: hypothetical protein [Pasteurellaceae]AOF54142.1 hypothetical protein AC062_2054 [Pasteurellaceae bacterium NI1060]MCQ9123015.1 hypothetical protein [Rodentibacter heylii]MCX2961463.1 hypothetical protein [Rodentibacter heylii]OOF70092.1 hypothetical protein BKG90_10625 [Rodentibacter heylii]OOF75095.1 hypothetical protein BKG99_09110 [Rodentibacter heylii]
MKKMTLALTVLLSLGLAACSSNNQKDESAYKGQVIFSEMKGENLQLTIRKNNCSYKVEGESETVTHAYDSTLVVGACVKVSDNGNGLKNISTWSPRNPI